tara:strand:- start:648 stop:1436 length:789 start_codon:yes stop_codon:yes gene_type:complete
MNKPVFSKNKFKINKGPKFKRLFFDIETSYNIVSSWNVGYELNISPDNIIKERAIICICYKWEDESKIHELHWDKGDDKQMLIKFSKIINGADEIIGHNGDNFDIKWLRTRCLFHSIDVFPDYQTVDTLKLSRGNFKFNSNKLDYIAKLLGLGGKMETGGLKLWDDIILRNNKTSLTKMIDYCKKDVLILEQVFKRLNPYVKSKTHVAVLEGGNRCSCPNCSSTRLQKRGTSVTASGLIKQRLQCQDCGKYTSIPSKLFEKK